MEFIKFPSFHTTVRTVRYATVQTNLNEEKQIRYCVYFRFRGFFDCTYLDISTISNTFLTQNYRNGYEPFPTIIDIHFV